MLKYINMPKLVAFYLKEFCLRTDENDVQTTSNLYKFIFCLCLPFLSEHFRKARLTALAIAECTNSRDQIVRLLNKLSKATFFFPQIGGYSASYNGADMTADFPYGTGNDTPLVSYSEGANESALYIQLNGETRESVEALLQLLIPFYIRITIIWQ